MTDHLAAQDSIPGDTISQDSIITPFRKGRWIVGLTGSLSSNRNETFNEGEETFNSRYGILMTGGHFFKDRWLAGGIIQMERENRESGGESTAENFFVGPNIGRYLSKTSYGSLYLSLSPGYVRYRDFVSIVDEGTVTSSLTQGGGFGMLISLGYSYVIWDRVSFDIGFNLNQYWIRAEQRLQPSGNVLNGNLQISSIDFTFGFRILLDKLIK